jgi:hypothetical protein
MEESPTQRQLIQINPVAMPAGTLFLLNRAGRNASERSSVRALMMRQT